MSHGVAPANSNPKLQDGELEQRVTARQTAAVRSRTAKCRLAVSGNLTVVDSGGHDLIQCIPVWVVIVACVRVEPGFVAELVLIVIAFFNNLIVVELANAIVVVVQACR